MKRREANERPDCNKQKEYNTKRAKEVAIERVREIKKDRMSVTYPESKYKWKNIQADKRQRA